MTFDNTKLSWGLVGHVCVEYILLWCRLIGSMIYGLCLGTTVVNVATKTPANWDVISKLFVAYKGRNLIRAMVKTKGAKNGKRNL
jgi:hypothetical protein